MKEEIEILEHIKVKIEVAPFLKRFTYADRNESQAFHNFLQCHLNDLVADLRIPAEITMVVGLCGDKHGLAVNSYRVSINNGRCRLSLPTTVAHDVDARELANSMARIIYQNRELALTPSLSKKVRQKWSCEPTATFLQSLSERSFHEFLLTFVRRSLRIDRGKKIAQSFRKKERKDWSLGRCIEEAVSELDVSAIKVFLCESTKAQVTLDDMSIAEMFDMMRDGLFYELGINLPKVDVISDSSLEEDEFRIQLNDLRFPHMRGLTQDQFLVNDTVEQLSILNISGEKAVNPANGSECAIVQNNNGAATICENAGLTTWGAAGYVVLSLSAEVRRNAGSFLTAAVVECSMNLLENAFPALINTVSNRFEIDVLAQILRDLLDEEISIRDLRSILESLLAINETIDVDLSKYIVFFPGTANICPAAKGIKLEDLNCVDYLNCVRMSLKRQISYKYTRGGNTLVVYLLDPLIEERIRDIDQLPLTDEESDKLITSIFTEVKNLPPTTRVFPVILTTLDIRKKLRNLIEKEFPRLAVLCYQELSPDMNIQPIARISCS